MYLGIHHLQIPAVAGNKIKEKSQYYDIHRLKISTDVDSIELDTFFTVWAEILSYLLLNNSLHAP